MAGVLDAFFPTADFAFGVLGTELWSKHGAAFGMRLVRRLGREGARDFAGRLLVSARDWLESTFASRKAHGVIAPWVLHTGLGPEAAASGYMAQVIAVAVQEGGMPIPVGGGAKLADRLGLQRREKVADVEPARASSRKRPLAPRSYGAEIAAAAASAFCPGFSPSHFRRTLPPSDTPRPRARPAPAERVRDHEARSAVSPEW